jgi:hypothetical protein
MPFKAIARSVEDYKNIPMYLDYEDRQNPQEMCAVVKSTRAAKMPFLLIANGYETPYPVAPLSYKQIASWNICVNNGKVSGEVPVMSGESFLNIPMLIVDALNSGLTRGDVLSMRVAKEL